MNHNPDPDVWLRPWSSQDLPLLERTRGDPEMNEHLGGPEAPDKIRERHERYLVIGGTSKGRMFVIVAGSAAESVGSVGYWEREWQRELVWETGWDVLPEFQGQGLATRGVTAAIEKARAERKHRFIHAFPSIDNLPSNAICKKVGFTLLGAFEFEYPQGSLMRSNDWSLDLSVRMDRADKAHRARKRYRITESISSPPHWIS